MNWHRLFGLLLTDFFAGSPYVVELEKDLSMKKQLLDVVILRKGPGQFTEPLSDGLVDLATHNLITFKSHQEALDDWALKELTGHYVNYRKQVSSSLEKLLPEAEIHLYAVSSRFPHNLANATDWRPVQAGVYECRRGSDAIRVVVLGELPKTENNALLHLLSAKADQVRYGATHFRKRASDTSTLLDRLLEGYQREGFAMPYTMEDFRREYLEENIKELSVEQRLKGLSPEEVLRGLSLSPEEMLRALSPEEIEKYLKRLKQEPRSRKRKKNG